MTQGYQLDHSLTLRLVHPALIMIRVQIPTSLFEFDPLNLGLSLWTGALACQSFGVANQAFQSVF